MKKLQRTLCLSTLITFGGLCLTIYLPAAYAVGEIKATASPARSLYAVLENASGQAWNGSAFVAFSDASYTSYALTLTEQGNSQQYLATFPAAITSPGRYSVVVYQQGGAAPSETDSIVTQGPLDWTGTGLVSEGVNTNTLATINTTTTSTNTLATGINTQTTKIATNAADSPNAVTAQSTTTSTSTAVAALPAANATAVWGSTTRALTDKANFTLVSTEYANIAAVTSTYGFDGPPAGTILTLTITRNGSSQPVLTWTADPAATLYKVYRSTDGANYTVIATPATGTLTYTDTARPAGATVYYHITSTH